MFSSYYGCVSRYVCLVLHSASKTEADRGEREVVCDYIRIWSTASTSAEFHHQALRDIHERYIEILPNLSELHIWSDGHSSTYKGHPNFGIFLFSSGVCFLHDFYIALHFKCHNRPDGYLASGEGLCALAQLFRRVPWRRATGITLIPQGIRNGPRNHFLTTTILLFWVPVG